MEYLSEHQRILELAAADNLPREIRENEDLPIGVVRELYEQGYLEAIDSTTFDGVCYLEARITIPGREYLNHQQQRKFEASIAGRARSVGLRLLEAGSGFVVGVLTTLAAAKLS